MMHSIHNLPANLGDADKILIKLVKKAAKELTKVAKRAEKSKDFEKLDEYFENVYDVEFSIGGNIKYRSVKICLAMGGPSVYFDTATGDVTGVWGFGDGFFETVDNEICYTVDDYFEDRFDTLRGF